MKKVLLVLFVTTFVIAGCYYDKEDLLYPAGNCDTSNSTYSAVVLPAMQNYGCMGCHSGAAPSGNIALSNYAEIKASAQNGKLFGSISHGSGFVAMPQGGNKMSTCDINKIKAWIDAGALNN